MKNFYNKIEETLKVSTAREYAKGWDKEKHAHMFPDGKYRIYLEMPEQELPFEETENMKKVRQFILGNAPYELHINNIDFESGLIESGGRKMRIGKIFNKIISVFNKRKNNEEAIIVYDREIDKVKKIQKLYNDEMALYGRKHSTSDYLIAISRHPYDIAGMSTDRDWTSCQNLGAKAVPGEEPKSPGTNMTYAKYVKGDIEEGTLVVYLIRKDDKNIKCPIGRRLIKPYFKTNDDSNDHNYCLSDDEWHELREENENNLWDDVIFRVYADNIHEIYRESNLFEELMEIVTDEIDIDEIEEECSEKDEDGDMVLDDDCYYEKLDEARDLELKIILRKILSADSERDLRIKNYTAYKIYNLLETYARENDMFIDEIADMSRNWAEEIMRDEGYMHEEWDECEKEANVDRDDVYYKLGNRSYNIPFSMIGTVARTVDKWLKKVQEGKEFNGRYRIAPEAYGGDDDTFIKL